jgi:uncharacterized protein
MKEITKREVGRREFAKTISSGAVALGLAGMNADLSGNDVKGKSSTRLRRGLMIDAFNHIHPAKYLAFIEKTSKQSVTRTGPFGPAMPSMSDIEARFRIMDRYEGYVQILNISIPPPEDALSPKDAVEACKIGNDGIAELVYKYPDRFVAGIAQLPFNNMDAAMKELDRAIKELHLNGVQIYSTIMDKTLDSPEFAPFFEKMNYYNLPIQIHPKTPLKLASSADTGAIIWPYETTVAMGRIVQRHV